MTRCLNSERLLSLFADDLEARQIIWQHVQNTFQNCLRTLHKVRQQQDEPTLWDRSLHELKGAAANIGAEQLVELAHQCRNLPPEKEEAAVALRQIQAAFDDLAEAIRPLLQR